MTKSEFLQNPYKAKAYIVVQKWNTGFRAWLYLKSKIFTYCFEKNIYIFDAVRWK